MPPRRYLWSRTPSTCRIDLSGGDDGVPGGVQATGTGIVNILNDDIGGVAMSTQRGVEGSLLVLSTTTAN